MLTKLQYHILKRVSREEPNCCSGGAYAEKSKLCILLGNDIYERISGKTVIDFGCGAGDEAIDMAAHGAKFVIGVDSREEILREAAHKACIAEVVDKCRFTTKAEGKADVLVSLDSFEHFADPPQILSMMADMLEPNGKALISFGPTWYHPFGGHLFSVFPWAHLLFSEKALIRWRADFKSDGATRFSEVAGGLNRMTISRFLKILSAAPFAIESLELVPIRVAKNFHNRLTREFTTSIVRCVLLRSPEPGQRTSASA